MVLGTLQQPWYTAPRRLTCSRGPAGVRTCLGLWRSLLRMWPGAVSMVVVPSTADGNPEITFHTEGHLLLRWGRDSVTRCEPGDSCVRSHYHQHTALHIHPSARRGSLINVGERKNLVSALMHSGFLHHWLRLHRYSPDIRRYEVARGGF